MSTRAKRSKRPPAKKKPKYTLRPHKIVGQLVAAVTDEKGEIVGEEVIGEVNIFRVQFPEVKKLADKAVQEAVRKGEEASDPDG